MIQHMWTNFFKPSDNLTTKSIKSCYLFSELTSRELKNLSRFVHVRHYNPGEVVFKQGELGVGMYIILEGAIDIYVDSTEDDATSRPITQLIKDDFMGEISLVETKSRRTASAIAKGDVTLIGFFKPDLDSIIDRNPSMGAKILNQLAKVLGRRLRETTKKVTELRIEINNEL